MIKRSYIKDINSNSNRVYINNTIHINYNNDKNDNNTFLIFITISLVLFVPILCCLWRIYIMYTKNTNENNLNTINQNHTDDQLPIYNIYDEMSLNPPPPYNN